MAGGEAVAQMELLADPYLVAHEEEAPELEGVGGSRSRLNDDGAGDNAGGDAGGRSTSSNSSDARPQPEAREPAAPAFTGKGKEKVRRRVPRRDDDDKEDDDRGDDNDDNNHTRSTGGGGGGGGGGVHARAPRATPVVAVEPAEHQRLTTAHNVANGLVYVLGGLVVAMVIKIAVT